MKMNQFQLSVYLAVLAITGFCYRNQPVNNKNEFAGEGKVELMAASHLLVTRAKCAPQIMVVVF